MRAVLFNLVCYCLRMELETKLQEMEKRKIDMEAEHHQRMEQAEEQCHRAADLREQAEKEAITCRQDDKHILIKCQLLYSSFIHVWDWHRQTVAPLFLSVSLNPCHIRYDLLPPRKVTRYIVQSRPHNLTIPRIDQKY